MLPTISSTATRKDVTSMDFMTNTAFFCCMPSVVKTCWLILCVLPVAERIIIRADGGFRTPRLLSWCDFAGVDNGIGMASNR